MAILLAASILANTSEAQSETFPIWSLKSNRDIDPRVRPNAGIRAPMTYFPIEGGPLLYPAFSPVAPDFDGAPHIAPWSIRTSIGLFGIDDEHVSAKFQEYRDVRNGATMGVEGHYRTGDTILNVFGRQIGRRDQDLVIDGGDVGKYLWSISYSETPHNYAFDTKSLWSGMGTSSLTLPDAMQADLQNSANGTELRDKLLGYVNGGAQNTDLALRRQSVGAEMTLLTTYPFAITASASNESRDGVRPWSASFAFFDFVEIPWTVQYDTHEARVSAEYAKPESRLYASAAYRYSEFVDHVQSLTFDNPFRVVDSPGTLVCTNACGPATGRLALYPSNDYNEVSGTIVIRKLPLNGVLNAYASAGFLRQNELLQPFSTNSALPPMQSLPRRTAEAAMDTQTVSVRWTGNLSKTASINAQYRMYRLDNDETPFTIDHFAREDQDIRDPNDVPGAGTYSTVLAQSTTQTASLEGSFYFSPDLKSSAEYTFERIDRDFREVARSDTNKMKLALDYRIRSSIDVKTSYEHSKRTTSAYDFNQYFIVQGDPLEHPMLPWIQKFDQAPLSRDEGQVMVTVPIRESMSVSAHTQLVSTGYGIAPLARRSVANTGVTAPPREDQQFGLRWSRSRSFGADFTYSPSDRVNVFLDAGFEHLKSEQMGRQWGPDGIGDPYSMEPTPESNSNWIARVRDNYYTGGVGFEAKLAQRLKLSLQYVLGKSDGRQEYSSPVGTAGDDLNPFVPAPFNDVDDTLTQSLNPELEYKYTENVSLTAGYHWEEWRVNDFNYKGFTYAPMFAAGPFEGVALLMGGILPKPYSANVVYVRVKLGL